MRKIHRYKKDGTYINTYSSIVQAQLDVGSKHEAPIRIAAKNERKSHGYFWSFKKYENLFTDDSDVIKENVRSVKQVQKFRDLNRIKDKAYREHARVENALEELSKSLIIELRDYGSKIKTVHHSMKKVGATLLVQLSDPHFNELIDLPNNRYDFIIAGQRLHKYANEIKLEAYIRGCKKIVLALTGDMLNSDRRIDELLAMSTNRAKASLIATRLLTYFITDLNDMCNVELAYVTGNESRIRDDYGFTDEFISDNYDVLIFNMLKMVFKDNPGITFIEGDPWELVLNINGKNILLSHGASIKGDVQAKIQQIVGKYAAKGILIDYIIIGHIHFANVTDLYTRSGSLCGNNTYSDRALDLITKASQVMHMITPTGDIHNKRIDLQNVEGFVGYPVEDDIEAYNAKSASKVHRQETIIKIVV